MIVRKKKGAYKLGAAALGLAILLAGYGVRRTYFPTSEEVKDDIVESSKEIVTTLRKKLPPSKGEKVLTYEEARAKILAKIEESKPKVEQLAPPVRRLVVHPTLGEVIEIRYADDSVAYEANDPIFDPQTGTFKEQEFAKTAEAPVVEGDSDPRLKEEYFSDVTK